MAGALNTGFKDGLGNNVEALVNPETGKLEVEAEIINNNGDTTEMAESEGLLSGILKELKIMNLHMAIMTDTHIQKSEVE